LTVSIAPGVYDGVPGSSQVLRHWLPRFEKPAALNAAA